MKTLILSVAAAVMILFTANAQPLKVGIKGGLSTYFYDFQRFTLDGTTIASGGSNNLGYQFGFAVRLTIPKFIHIQSEMNFSSRDYNLLTRSSTGGATNRLCLTTERVEVPLTVGFNIYALRIFGGPVFRLTSQQTSNNAANPVTIDFRSKDVAMMFGVGLDIHKFFVDVRYTTYPNTTFEVFRKGDLTRKVKITGDETWQLNMGFFF